MSDKFECRFCSKQFTRESTLISHVCTKKKRYEDRETAGARLGLYAYNIFLKSSANRRPETPESFINCKFYIDFVKFGRTLCDIDPLDTEAYIKWLVSNNIQLKQWSKLATYQSFVISFLEREPVERSLERSVIRMGAWADREGLSIVDYFDEVTTYEATQDISNGRITPWVLYVSANSGKLLERMDEQQLTIIGSIINPGEWQLIFSKRPKDLAFAKTVLGESGL